MWHSTISFIKSGIRILSGILALFFGINILIIGLIVAEILGIVEELK